MTFTYTNHTDSSVYKFSFIGLTSLLSQFTMKGTTL